MLIIMWNASELAWGNPIAHVHVLMGKASLESS